MVANTFPPSASGGSTGGIIGAEVPAYEINYTEVNTYTDLPAANTQPNKVFIVRQDSGTWSLGTKKKSGLYYSNGTVWSFMGNSVSLDDTVASNESVYSSSKVTAMVTGVSNEVDVINQALADMNEPNGFIRESPETMGIMELCTDGTTVYSINGDGILSTRSDGKFATGTAYEATANAKEFAIYPNGVSYKVYVEGTLHTITTLQRVTLVNASGLQFVFHQLDGTLASDTVFAFDYFEDRPVTAVVYGNAVTQELVLFGDERHGIQMDGTTHRYLHFTQGTRYVSGMEIQGLASGGTTYSAITSGYAYDEDIYMNPPIQTNAPFYYLDGTSWRIVNDTTHVAHLVTGVAQHNLKTGATYSLAPVTGNDAMIVFFALTNNKLAPYVKILGQSVYADTNAARAGISDALNDLVLAGLPSPEFLPIGAVIVRSAGEVQTLSDGSLYYDLRTAKIGGNGTSSTASTYHQDLLNLQGGIANEYYHLTAVQHTDLTDGGNSSSHKHDDLYSTLAHTHSTYLATTGGVTTGAITGLRETKVAMGTTEINLANGNVFDYTVAGATTFTKANALAAPAVNSFTLRLTNGGAYPITWTSLGTMKWIGGVAPTFTVSGVDRVSFESIDGGTTWEQTGIAKDIK